MAEGDFFKKVVGFANDIANESEKQEENYRQVKKGAQKFASNLNVVYNEIQYWGEGNRQKRLNDDARMLL